MDIIFGQHSPHNSCNGVKLLHEHLQDIYCEMIFKSIQITLYYIIVILSDLIYIVYFCLYVLFDATDELMAEQESTIKLILKYILF